VSGQDPGLRAHWPIAETTGPACPVFPLPGRVTGYQVTALDGLSGHRRITLTSPGTPPAEGVQWNPAATAAGRPGAMMARPARCPPGTGPLPRPGGGIPGTRHGRRPAAAGALQ
jgi:hypothetical protein